jgi:hypothetical protein
MPSENGDQVGVQDYAERLLQRFTRVECSSEAPFVFANLQDFDAICSALDQQPFRAG